MSVILRTNRQAAAPESAAGTFQACEPSGSRGIEQRPFETLAGDVDDVERLQREERRVPDEDAPRHDDADEERRQRHGHERAEGERDHARLRLAPRERVR